MTPDDRQDERDRQDRHEGEAHLQFPPSLWASTLRRVGVEDDLIGARHEPASYRLATEVSMNH